MRELAWRELPDGTVEVPDPRGGPAIRYRAGIGALLADVRDRRDLAQLATHFPKSAGERAQLRAKQFLLQLRRLGYLDIPLDAPRMLGGRYEIVRELGRGGVGVAWLCREGAREVVVKAAWDFLAPLRVADAAVRAEDAILRDLAFPGIVERLGSFEERGRLHLVRAFVDGPDLGAHERAPVDEPTARALVAQAAWIVARAHEAGYLLIDLRPGNFVRADRLVLLDAGLARRHADGVAQLEAPVGVAGFLAPEILRERRAQRESDVWALGALYAFLRVGRHDAKGDVIGLAARLPSHEAALVARLCAPEPEKRPLADEVARELA